MTTPLDDEAILAEERRRGRFAGVAAIGSIVATVATVMVASAATGGSGLPKGAPGIDDEEIDRAKVLVDFDENMTQLAISTGLRCLALLLMIVIGVHLYRVTRTRDENAVKPWVLYLTFIGPTLMCVSLVVGFVAFGQVADELVASGPRTVERAKQLIDDSTGLTLAQAGDVAFRIPVALWLAILATSAMKVGLLTRFLGYWGVAAGASLVILSGTGDAMMAGWIGSMGILALGAWPGGRPAAWDSTEPQEIEAI